MTLASIRRVALSDVAPPADGRRPAEAADGRLQRLVEHADEPAKLLSVRVRGARERHGPEHTGQGQQHGRAGKVGAQKSAGELP